MSLSQVRTYFQKRIAAVDASFFEWDESVPRNTKDKSYSIELGEVSSGPLRDNFIDDNMSVVVKLYYKEKKSAQNLIDTALDEAHNIRKESVKVANAMSGTNIKNVVCESIYASTNSGSDNSVIVNLEFTVRLIFGF